MHFSGSTSSLTRQWEHIQRSVPTSSHTKCSRQPVRSERETESVQLYTCRVRVRVLMITTAMVKQCVIKKEERKEGNEREKYDYKGE